MKYRNIKIRVNPDNSAAVQERLFEDGCEWVGGGANVYGVLFQFLFVDNDGIITYLHGCESVFNAHGLREVLAQQILDPYHEIKLAWANGEALQFKIFDEWMDWIGKDDLSLSASDEWRIKPKTKTIKQWERKYMSRVGFVVTVHSAQKPDWHENWLGDAYQAEHEVPNDK